MAGGRLRCTRSLSLPLPLPLSLSDCACVQAPGQCLAASVNKIGDVREWEADQSAHSFRWGSPQLAAVRPELSWLLADASNRVYFRPACVVDLSNGHLRDQNVRLFTSLSTLTH